MSLLDIPADRIPKPLLWLLLHLTRFAGWLVGAAEQAMDEMISLFRA